MEVQQSKARYAIERLVNLYASGDLSKESLRVRRESIEAELAGRQVEIDRLTSRLSRTIAIPPEQEAAIREFQRQIAGRMTDSVPFEERLKLFDLLRIACIYNSDTRELVITGMLGEYAVDTTAKHHLGQTRPPMLLIVHL